MQDASAIPAAKRRRSRHRRQTLSVAFFAVGIFVAFVVLFDWLGVRQ